MTKEIPKKKKRSRKYSLDDSTILFHMQDKDPASGTNKPIGRAKHKKKRKKIFRSLYMTFV